MDARLWHQQARMTPPPAPQRLSLKELRNLTGAPKAEYLRRRRRWLSGLQFTFDEGLRATTQLTDLVDTNQLRPPGAKDVIGISAPFAVGKSTLVRSWAQGIYRDIIGSGINDPAQPTWQMGDGVVADHVPVAWLDMIAAAKIKAFNTQLLRFFGYPVHGAIRDLTDRIADAVDNHKLQLLIVDDANLLNFRHRDSRDVLDHLKHVNTLLGQRGASMVLVGADLENSPIAKDPQMAGRMRIIRLRPFNVDTENGVQDWQQFLFGIEQTVLPYLPAAEPHLLAGKLSPRIWRRTQGYVGDTVRLIADAAHLAALDDCWTIKATHLERVSLSERATTDQPIARAV